MFYILIVTFSTIFFHIIVSLFILIRNALIYGERHKKNSHKFFVISSPLSYTVCLAITHNILFIFSSTSFYLWWLRTWSIRTCSFEVSSYLARNFSQKRHTTWRIVNWRRIFVGGSTRSTSCTNSLLQSQWRIWRRYDMSGLYMSLFYFLTSVLDFSTSVLDFPTSVLDLTTPWFDYSISM